MRKLLLLVSLPLAAHELYLMPQKFFVRAGDKVEVSINSGDSFPESEVAPRLSRLEELSGPAQVTQCYRCHQTTSWNDIRGVGYYKHN